MRNNWNLCYCLSASSPGESQSHSLERRSWIHILEEYVNNKSMWYDIWVSHDAVILLFSSSPCDTKISRKQNVIILHLGAFSMNPCGPEAPCFCHWQQWRACFPGCKCNVMPADSSFILLLASVPFTMSRKGQSRLFKWADSVGQLRCKARDGFTGCAQARRRRGQNRLFRASWGDNSPFHVVRRLLSISG